MRVLVASIAFVAAILRGEADEKERKIKQPISKEDEDGS